MSANIQSIMYAKETPWHGQGTYVGENEITAEQALIASKLNWEVELKDVYAGEKGFGHVYIKGKKAVVRKDNSVPLGVVGKNYRPLQNQEMFKFLESIVGRETAVFHTAGALGQGERVWALLKVPGEIRITGDDIVEKYFLSVNSHDGYFTYLNFFTTIRVVCQNTLHMALNQAISGEKIYSIRHTATMQEKMDTVRTMLMQADSFWTKMQYDSAKLLQKKIGYEEMNVYFEKSLGLVRVENELSSRGKAILMKVNELAEAGKGTEIQGVKGSVWGAYNAVTEFVDFYRTNKNESKRANSILFGTGRDIKENAWRQALELSA